MDKQQEMLFDYTKFHIGIYISIGTALVGVLAFDQNNHNHILGDVLRCGFECALVLQALAGLGGGLICTNLIRSTSYEAFNKKRIFMRLSPWYWEKIEHLSFWASVIIAGACGGFFARSTWPAW